MRLRLVLASGLFAGCIRVSGPEPPRPQHVEPPRGRSDTAQTVTLHGSHFFVRRTQRLDGRSVIEEASYRAWLGDTELLEVQRVDAATLTARVPAGLAPGTHDLVVLGPYGAGMAADAYVTSDEPEVVPLLDATPLGADTVSAFVFPHNDGERDWIIVGPRRDGTGAVRVAPDGSSVEALSFSFPADTVGNQSTNACPGCPPYPSIGAAACASDTVACGPDNEDGAGLFFGGTFLGAPWLGIGGSKSGGSLEYVYMTPDTGSALGFRYVDLSAILGGGTHGFAAALVFGDRLYLGFPDKGGNRPYLVALLSPPPTPGLDVARDIGALNLDAHDMPGVGQGPGTIIIDALASFADRLYLGNHGAWMRSTTVTPGSYAVAPGDWAPCTPAAAAYAAKISRTTAKVAGIEPADRAVVAFAPFGGLLFAGRNTTTGPQLWSCDPGRVPPAADCDPADWSLIAANATGDEHSQLDRPALAAVTLLIATPRHLYVGWDSVGGAVVFRAAVAPRVALDFEGEGGCRASDPACVGLGGMGLGDATNTRIYAAAAASWQGRDYLYVTVGNGVAGVRVYRLSD